MPSNGNLWENDSLNRQEEGEYLSNYLIKYFEKNQDSSFVLNINAEWGFGKTYFLTNLVQELENKKYPAVYFDAWKNDFSNQPLLAFLSELNTSLEPYFSRSKKGKKLLGSVMNKTKGILFPIGIKMLTGMAADKLEEVWNKESDITPDTNEEDSASEEIEEQVSTMLTKFVDQALLEHKSVQDSIELFKLNMKRLLKHIDKNLDSRNLPMFIFIDELDRCRPNYAIELLENIKHIFDIPGIIFVVATDSKQLAHSINAVYGQDFASERYLKRFFDQEYSLVNPNSYEYAYYLFSNHEILNSEKLFSPLIQELYEDKNINVQLFTYYAEYFKLSLRDQEQAMLVLLSIIIMWDNNNKIHLGYLLFLIMLKQHNNKLFDDFINGNNTVKSSFLKEHRAELNVDTSIYFNSKEIIDRFSLSLKKYPLEHIINGYVNILDKKADTLLPEGNIKNLTVQNIIREIKRLMPSAYPSTRPPEHDLNGYPNLVLRAGQFS